MEATNLLEKKHSWLLKGTYIGILFLAVFSGIFYLYGYLWQTLGRPVAKSLASDYYLENKRVACTADIDCMGTCTVGELGAGEACVCLSGQCHFIANEDHFSRSKFCQHDSDCIVSCYEGPVSRQYYDAVRGFERDCTEGCKMSDAASEASPSAVCVNNQCKYETDRTCFLGAIPQ